MLGTAVSIRSISFLVRQLFSRCLRHPKNKQITTTLDGRLRAPDILAVFDPPHKHATTVTPVSETY